MNHKLHIQPADIAAVTAINGDNRAAVNTVGTRTSFKPL